MDRRRFSLKYKFILTLVAFTFLLSLSFGGVSLKRLSSELHAQLVEEGRDLASTLAEKFSDTTIPLYTFLQNLQFLQESSSGDVLYIQIMVGEQRYNVFQPGLDELPPLEVELAKEGMIRRQLPDGTDYLDFWEVLPRRLMMSPEGIDLAEGPNYVRVGLSFARIQGEIRQALWIISFVALGFILVGVLVAFLFYQMVLGPVEGLIGSVKLFRVDRRARAPVRGTDELTLLAQEFNKMADTIAERDERLEQMNRELLEANRVKSEFLAMMGHELKTPLHAIRGFSQLLLEEIDGPLTAKQREDIQAVLGSGDHLLELIDNILRFSKLEAGEERLHLEEVEPEELLSEVVGSFARLAPKREIRLESKVDPFMIRADRTKLKQVLMNLVSNALKYTKRGWVRVTAEQANGAALFAVEDTGPGIPPEYQERVFEPFIQLDSSTTREMMGLGLGLAIVKKYVEMHGGQVWLRSEPGQGSQFCFTIPQEAGHADLDC